MTKFDYQIDINSDSSLLISFKDSSNSELSSYIAQLTKSFSENTLEHFIEAVSAYNSILLLFYPLGWQPQKTINQINKHIELFRLATSTQISLIRVPICYDPEVATDLDTFCSKKNISIARFIELHTKPTYRIEMLGFLPGFLYLSGLDPLLAQPRKSTPDYKIPAGSVAIGGNQAGIYPIESPGGWHIIGRTPLKFFDSERSPPTLANPMDKIKFYAISYQEYCGYEY